MGDTIDDKAARKIVATVEYDIDVLQQVGQRVGIQSLTELNDRECGVLLFDPPCRRRRFRLTYVVGCVQVLTREITRINTIEIVE